MVRSGGRWSCLGAVGDRGRGLRRCAWPGLSLLVLATIIAVSALVRGAFRNLRRDFFCGKNSTMNGFSGCRVRCAIIFGGLIMFRPRRGADRHRPPDRRIHTGARRVCDCPRLRLRMMRRVAGRTRTQRRAARLSLRVVTRPMRSCRRRRVNAIDPWAGQLLVFAWIELAASRRLSSPGMMLRRGALLRHLLPALAQLASPSATAAFRGRSGMLCLRGSSSSQA